MFHRKVTILFKIPPRLYCSAGVRSEETANYISVNGREFECDAWSNVSSKILSHLGRNLHLQQYHPLSFIRQRIVDLFYKRFVGRRGNPVFSVYNDLSPVVSVKQNFDNLLIPPGHESRKKSDCYYINRNYLLRAHTTAHQSELISMGLNNFLVVGDVYRRDETDSTHYPVFHQIDAVRLCSKNEVSFKAVQEEAPFFNDGVSLVFNFFLILY